MQVLNLKSAFRKEAKIIATGELINGAGFGVFDNAETVLAIAVPGCAEYTRKQTDELTEWVKRPQIGMQGLVYIKCNV
ncbi:GAD domain-containing protein, partial [Acinetobacter baumannii]